MPAHQEGALRHQVDPEIVELDDVRLVEQQSAADPSAAVLTRCLQADQVRKLGGVRAALLNHCDAMGRRHCSGIDRVHPLGTEPAEERGEQRRRQDRAVIGRNLTHVIDLQPRRRLTTGLGEEATDALRHRNEGPQEGHRLRQRDRGVQREPGQAAIEHGNHLVRDLERHADLRFLGGGAQVRRGDHLGQRQ